PPPPLQEVKKEGPLSAEDIRYPASDLGNCQSETECRSYCDVVDNAKACFTFAKKYNLISEEESQKVADEFLNVKNGPGGCNSGKSCEDYCSTVDHLDECIDFAEKTGYYSPEELAEARKFQELVKSGAQFPGGCKDRNTCEVYCSDSNHMEECLDFAETSGFMPPDEIAEARKFMALMQQGESPGGCNSKEQCENYCFEESHINECIDFAEKAGVMTAEEAEMVRKIGGKGPGGCRSKAQCDTYCEANSEECFNFAKENGMISEDDLVKMREGMARFRDELDKMPPEAVECMKNAAGEENFNKMLAGEPVFDRSLEEKMKSCFTQVTNDFGQQLSNIPPEAAQCIIDAIGEDGLQKLKDGELDEDLDFGSLEACFKDLQGSFGGGGGGNFGNGGFSGPGGCTNTVECTAFCQENPDESQGFGPPGGGSSSGGGGGGGTPPSPTSSCVQPPSSLVSWWSADIVSGAIVPDINASNGNNGTIAGGVTAVSMEVGDAFQFDGSSGYISMGNPASLNFGTGPFSLEAWFNWNGALGTSAKNIIRKSNYGPGLGSGYWLRIGAGTLEFSVGATTQAEGQTIITTPVSAGVWRHVVAVKDSSGDVKLYVDGESTGTILRQSPDTNSTSEVPFLIGAWSHGGGAGASEFFNGQIDEIAVYNRALSASEARALFDSGSIGKCATSYGRTNRELPQDYQQQYQQQQSQQQQSQQQMVVCPEYVSVTECLADQERFLSHDAPGCQLYSCRPKQQQSQPSSTQLPSGGGSGGGTGILITPEICANFTSVPACSYVGSPDSQDYKLCAQCYPDKINSPTSKATTLDALLAVPLAPFLKFLNL
ncbi:MAG: LamG domain-containing protein, partial [Patescibacteria group bacterium]